MLCLSEDENPLTCDGIMQGPLQTMGRELKLLDSLFDLLHEVTHIELNGYITHIELCSSSTNQPKGVSEASSLLAELIALIYRAISFCFKENRENENYVAVRRQENSTSTYLDKIIRDVVYHNDAAECLTLLVSNNRKMLETVAASMMDSFVDLLKKKGPQRQVRHVTPCSCLAVFTFGSHNVSFAAAAIPGGLGVVRRRADH
jgi:hypothetical protein